MVNSYFKDLPILDRQSKPRETGINYVRAPVMAGSVVEDYLAAFGEMVDIFKLSGKQAMMMSDDSLKAFISACKNHQVMVAVGNPVMDVALTGGRETVEGMLASINKLGVDIVELSSVARAIDDQDVCRIIESANKKGIKVINEVGVAFAHSRVGRDEMFVENVKKQTQRFLEAGSWKILLESEGLSENMGSEPIQWPVIDSIISHMDLKDFMVEADDQDILSKYIEIYGPNINMMVDHSRVLKMEDARIGFGPSQFLWGKVVKY